MVQEMGTKIHANEHFSCYHRWALFSCSMMAFDSHVWDPIVLAFQPSLKAWNKEMMQRWCSRYTGSANWTVNAYCFRSFVDTTSTLSVQKTSGRLVKTPFNSCLRKIYLPVRDCVLAVLSVHGLLSIPNRMDFKLCHWPCSPILWCINRLPPDHRFPGSKPRVRHLFDFISAEILKEIYEEER